MQRFGIRVGKEENAAQNLDAELDPLLALVAFVLPRAEEVLD